MSVKKNLVKATSATTGTGTLTLSPMTGWANFSDAYTNGTIVPYAIENGDNKEVGLGTVGASSTLARTTVLATLVGGVYDDTSPVAITLSGNSTVFSGPLAELFDVSEISGLGTAATANTGTSGHVLPYLDVSNTFTATQHVQSDGTVGGGDAIVNLRRSDATPTAGDLLGSLYGYGNNSTPAIMAFGGVHFTSTTITAGSEAGRTAFNTRIGASYAPRMSIEGGVWGAGATGGDKGAGTSNWTAVYDDNVPLTCYAIEAYKQGSVDIAYWDAKVLDLEIPAQPEQVETRPVTRKVQRPQRVRDGARLVRRMV